MLSNETKTLVNLNRMTENILITIEIPFQNYSDNIYYLAIIVILILIYVYRRFQYIRMIK